ncbi:MAG: nucleotide exchange factor GrpE [Acidobacteria bacterium]|nr:nucleotide exchange factor GrpE [Acidobacteriota bacterium]
MDSETDQQAAAGASPLDRADCVQPSPELAALAAERDRLAAERDELKDLLQRRQAEFENFRRRTERDRSEYLQFAAFELIRELVPILDDFERALRSQDAADAGDASSYVRGIELIYQRLYETLKKMGLEPIESAGRKFDPHVHQAVDRAQTSEIEDQTILEEYQRGYNFRGKLLRPAMVKVAVNP